MIRKSIHINGIVQGVGFRPFVYTLANRMGLTGWIRNTSAGVDIEIEGDLWQISDFLRELSDDAPSLSHIDSIDTREISPIGSHTFEILYSEPIPDAFQPISPDICICPDCLRELFDPSNRRYRYPFINCTNCGPRFTIVEDIPYDRPKTTMSSFPMCPDCSAEYKDPGNRRFHAQPIACSVCGPHVWLEISNKSTASSLTLSDLESAIEQAQGLLLDGKIIAVKGLGGFHLACNAEDVIAVKELRSRKLRVDKPFAVMFSNISAIETHCYLNEQEREILLTRERPIVIVNRKPNSTIAPDVAPNQNTLGVMLPYTPLHYLLFSPPGSQQAPFHALVMTSGNLSEEPIAIDNDEARSRLTSLADAFLMHNRPIRTRCDDSVVRVFSTPKSHQIGNQGFVQSGANDLYPIRRSRGYAPFPIRLPVKGRSVLATGGELKNTFCLTREHYAFLSHHIGDMENLETFQSFEDGIHHFEKLFRIKPEIIAYDLHPNYLASRYALERSEQGNIPSIAVQHHHAHITSCMIENNLPPEQPVIGVSFDGTGYGTNGAIWGGEFLVADYRSFERISHLKYIPLPGGDQATRKPARTALAHLWSAGIEWDPSLPPASEICADERSAILFQLVKGINTPLTSSMGRLFDAVASLIGVRHQVNYEAQAAIELEALVDPGNDFFYSFEYTAPLPKTDNRYPTFEIDPAPLFNSIINDLHQGKSLPAISTQFHNGVAHMVAEVISRISNFAGIRDVVLSGGVWQNQVLLSKTIQNLSKRGYKFFIHSKVPANDGGIALGQAAVALFSEQVN